MAEDLTAPEATEQPAATPQPQPPRERRRDETVYTGRFRVIYAVLAVALGAAVGALVVLTGGAGSSDGPRWSAWKPTGASEERTQAIADVVSARYRLESGRQLVAVSVAHPPTVGSGGQPVAVRWVAFANGPNQDDISVMPAEDTVAYALCGLGEGCAIREGEPTVERGRLLRREALELALYTFKYVDGIDSVVAFLPPSPGTRPRFALFFQKDDDYVKDALHRPLTSTLAPEPRLTPSTMTSVDANFVTRFVEPHLFQYSFNQAGDGSVYLALQPPAV